MPEELKPAIHSKRKGMLTKQVVLHHDNAQPHSAAAIIEMIPKLKFEFHSHPAYRPNLFPYDYHISGPVKMRYMNTILQMMKRSRMRYTRGFMRNHKHSSQMASGSSWSEVTNMWRS
jgi:hypothetical protein